MQAQRAGRPKKGKRGGTIRHLPKPKEVFPRVGCDRPALLWRLGGIQHFVYAELRPARPHETVRVPVVRQGLPEGLPRSARRDGFATLGRPCQAAAHATEIGLGRGVSKAGDDRSTAPTLKRRRDFGSRLRRGGRRSVGRDQGARQPAAPPSCPDYARAARPSSTQAPTSPRGRQGPDRSKTRGRGRTRQVHRWEPQGSTAVTRYARPL